MKSRVRQGQADGMWVIGVGGDLSLATGRRDRLWSTGCFATCSLIRLANIGCRVVLTSTGVAASCKLTIDSLQRMYLWLHSCICTRMFLAAVLLVCLLTCGAVLHRYGVRREAYPEWGGTCCEGWSFGVYCCLLVSAPVLLSIRW